MNNSPGVVAMVHTRGGVQPAALTREARLPKSARSCRNAPRATTEYFLWTLYRMN